MANVFKQTGVHVVTAVKHRDALILPEWRYEIERYIKSVIERRGSLYIECNAMPDYIHLFFGLHQTEALADITGAWKASSSSFISSTYGIDFDWQRGYGAFNVSRSHWDAVIQYVRNQLAHHETITWPDEYRQILRKNHIDYDDRYLFDDVYAA